MDANRYMFWVIYRNLTIFIFSGACLRNKCSHNYVKFLLLTYILRRYITHFKIAALSNFKVYYQLKVLKHLSPYQKWIFDFSNRPQPIIKNNFKHLDFKILWQLLLKVWRKHLICYFYILTSNKVTPTPRGIHYSFSNGWE